jgi:hypothetical protein
MGFFPSVNAKNFIVFSFSSFAFDPVAVAGGVALTNRVRNHSVTAFSLTI